MLMSFEGLQIRVVIRDRSEEVRTGGTFQGS